MRRNVLPPPLSCLPFLDFFQKITVATSQPKEIQSQIQVIIPASSRSFYSTFSFSYNVLALNDTLAEGLDCCALHLWPLTQPARNPGRLTSKTWARQGSLWDVDLHMECPCWDHHVPQLRRVLMPKYHCGDLMRVPINTWYGAEGWNPSFALTDHL